MHNKKHHLQSQDLHRQGRKALHRTNSHHFQNPTCKDTKPPSKTKKRNSTKFSKYIWKLKDEGTPYTITWKVIRHAQPYSPRTKHCNLCLWLKYFIITAHKDNILNSRTKLISTSRHKKNILLSGYGWAPPPPLIFFITSAQAGQWPNTYSTHNPIQ